MAKTFVYIGNMRAGTQLAAKLVEAGFEAAPEVESADFVVTYLLQQADQEDAYFGTDGIIARANPGTVIVDLSPTTPTFARELSAMAAVNDMHMVEAPLVVHDVTLANAFSQPGNLALFVGGDSADITAATPLLGALSVEQTHCGATGQASMARCAASLMRASQALSLAESRALLQYMPDARPDALGRALAVCEAPSWLEALVKAIDQKAFDGVYTVEMAYGEVASAIDAAEDVSLVAPHAETIEYLLEMMMMVGGADMALAALGLLYVDEESSRAYGLDWTRAEAMYGQMFDDGHHHHDHHHAHDDGIYEDLEGFDDFGMGYDGKDGFGGYSAN